MVVQTGLEGLRKNCCQIGDVWLRMVLQMRVRTPAVIIIVVVLTLAASLLAPLFSKKAWPPPSLRSRIHEARELVNLMDTGKTTVQETLAQYHQQKQRKGGWMLSVASNGEAQGIETPWFDLTEAEEKDYRRPWQKSYQYRVRAEKGDVFVETRDGTGALVESRKQLRVPMGIRKQPGGD